MKINVPNTYKAAFKVTIEYVVSLVSAKGKSPMFPKFLFSAVPLLDFHSQQLQWVCFPTVQDLRKNERDLKTLQKRRNWLGN